MSPSTTLPTTVGWSISQWTQFTSSAESSAILQSLLDLVGSFSSKDPAWISIASHDQIQSQWESIQSLPNAKTVSLLFFLLLLFV